MNKAVKSLAIIGVGGGFLVSVGVVAASSSTTASSPLYPIKRAIEAVTLVSASSNKKASVQAKQVEERLAELKVLKAKIAVMKQKQEADKARELVKIANKTREEARKILLEAKRSSELIDDGDKKNDVENKIELSEDKLDKEKEDVEEVEPSETPEPSEAIEQKEKIEQKQENSKDTEKSGDSESPSSKDSESDD